MKVFDDLFANCCVRLERSLDIFQTDGYLARGTKLKAPETVSYDRFLPKQNLLMRITDSVLLALNGCI